MMQVLLKILELLGLTSGDGDVLLLPAYLSQLHLLLLDLLFELVSFAIYFVDEVSVD